MKIVDLRTNNRRENLNIVRQDPCFGWRAEGEEENACQISYRLCVRRESKEVVWDSGIVQSSRMTAIPYAGKKLLSAERYFLRVECVFDARAGQRYRLCAESFFETGYFEREDWLGCFIGETMDHEHHLFRKTFSSAKSLKRARLSVCGLGHFECWLNAARVSENVLEPGWTDYRKTCFYTAYDVTKLVQNGGNVLLVKLGDGMFHVPGGRYVYYERSYGKSKLLLQLELLYEDGTKTLVVTDETWRMAPGPVKFCCIYGGEDYDGRLWKDTYLHSSYREEEIWQPAVCVKPPEGKLTAMPTEPLRVRETFSPVCIKRLRAGVWLYDLGTNFSGWARITIHTDGTMAGREIVLKPGEILGENGGVNQRVTGEGYAWTYILNEEPEQEFAPDFTYTGFRYVEMSGAVPKGQEEDREAGGLPVLKCLTGEFIYPDVAAAGQFTCSNTLFNAIHSLVLTAVKSNTKSYFTDCPHREKLGWLEQTHLIGPSIMYNLDVHNLYEKIEEDMADAQRESGLVSDICPEYVTGFEKWHEGFVDSPEWGSACILNPWYVYKRYGDPSLLGRSYPMMKRYLDYLESKTHHGVLHHGLGDWLDIGPCTPHSQNTPVPVTATCIYYLDLKVMRQTAELLSKEEDSIEYGARMERTYREYNLQFLDDQTGRYASGSQTAQAMSLMSGLVPPEMEAKVTEQLKEDLVKRKYAITAGDIGHPFLIAALMKYGMTELLSEMTHIVDTPGYGYQVACGATALTEEWDGPNPAKPHGSQNHLMLGSIEEFFYGALAGMELIRQDLPFGEVRIRPYAPWDMDWVRAWCLHPYGRIETEWKREGKTVEVMVRIPPNVTAHLESPDGSVKRTVGSGRHSFRFEIEGE